MNDALNINLIGLAEVRAGYPFRGAVPLVEHGSVRAVQMRDITSAAGVDWSGCALTELESHKSSPDWIVSGDILFAPRGNRYYGVHVESVPGQAVCGQHLFHIRLRDTAQILPAFLTWQINQPPLQKLLFKMAEGSSQLSIRRSMLETLPLTVPALRVQESILALARSADQERTIYTALIKSREKQLEALANGLAQNLTPTSHKT